MVDKKPIKHFQTLAYFPEVKPVFSKKQLKPYTSLYPTPVVLVTSSDAKGKPNIITLAWTGVLCSAPPQIGISMTPSRYSHELIRNKGEFVVNMPTADILKEVDYCGIISGRRVDKFEKTGLTPVKANKVEPPLIKECPVNLECMVKNIVQLGTHDLFVGEVVCVNMDESESKGVEKDLTKLRPIVFNPMTGQYFSLGKLLGSIGFSKKR